MAEKLVINHTWDGLGDLLAQSTLPEIYTRMGYDVITFYDALEHFEDIYFLEKLKCKYLVISLPNCKYPTDDVWLSQWKHLKPNEHLYHMNEKSLTNLLVASGYKIECVSYYEDIIRRDKNLDQNILTIIGKK